MSQFLFEGHYRRTPRQTLGGNSRASEDRGSLIQRADAERKQRERERQEQASILKLQGFFRACLDRKRIHAAWRVEFDQKKKLQLNDEEFLAQIFRLNLFYRNDKTEDTSRLLELGKLLLTKYQLVTGAMKTNNTVAFAMKQIIHKCLRCLNMPNVPYAVLLRLIEIYTDASKYTDNNPSEPSSEPPLLKDDIVKLISGIWLFLVEEADLFVTYRRFLDHKIPPMQSEAEQENRITQNYDYLLVYKRVLHLKTDLKNRNLQISMKSKVYDSEAAIDLIMAKFAESFSENVIPLEGNNGIAAYFILPRLSNFIPWEEWVKTAPLSKLAGKSDGSGMRHIFYVTLLLMRNMTLTDANIPTFLKALNELRPSIDPIFGPGVSNHGLTREIENIDEEMDILDDEDEMETDENFAKHSNNIYLQECRVIYAALKSVLNKAEIASWLYPFQLHKWKLITEIISCVIRLEPKLSTIDFNFLSSMSYRRDYVRSLCLHVIGTPILPEDDLLAFCWFISHLLGTLHDPEFLTGIPVQKEELVRLVVVFRDLFSEKVMKESAWAGNAPGASVLAITGVLMKLHDRNSRMNLFPEDIFISNTLSKICPVETHSIRLESLTSEKLPNDLTPMEEKLFKILMYFPFALSFHDRVKVWNRLLDLDKQTNEPFPTAGREDIQIRRNYIYEDAFEKLSPENVPDLRRHIRISLVNVVGVLEAGIDGGGLLREFLTESTKAAVDPNRGLFRFDSQNRIYPNPIAKKLMFDFRKHFYAVGRLVGKALYEQTLLELPIAAFFIQYCIEGKVTSAVDFLATLDPALHKNLLTLKTFKGDLNTMGLDFTIAAEELGETRIIDLKRNGKEISVDNTNVIEYIHLVADYRINKEMEDECRNFRAGMLDVVPSVRMFSWKELQTLISGSDKPINIDDWRANTNYGDNFSDNHATIQIFWQVVRSFDEKCLRMLLKFVTSCSRPPLLGFKDLVPKFGIQNVGKTDRLPTASTCMNLLKLPEFTDFTTLKEKLMYVINAHAGFELS